MTLRGWTISVAGGARRRYVRPPCGSSRAGGRQPAGSGGRRSPSAHRGPVAGRERRSTAAADGIPSRPSSASPPTRPRTAGSATPRRALPAPPRRQDVPAARRGRRAPPRREPGPLLRRPPHRPRRPLRRRSCPPAPASRSRASSAAARTRCSSGTTGTDETPGVQCPPKDTANGDEGFGDYCDPARHTGKLDRVRLRADGTVTVDRMDLVANRQGGRVLARPHRPEPRLRPLRPPPHALRRDEPRRDDAPPRPLPDARAGTSGTTSAYQEWMGDHLHARVCDPGPCPTNTEGPQRMGDWAGLAVDARGDLWHAGRWTAGLITWVPSPVEWFGRNGARVRARLRRPLPARAERGRVPERAGLQGGARGRLGAPDRRRGLPGRAGLVLVLGPADRDRRHRGGLERAPLRDVRGGEARPRRERGAATWSASRTAGSSSPATGPAR